MTVWSCSLGRIRMLMATQNEQTLLIRTGFPLLSSSIVRLDKSTGLGMCKRHGVLTNRWGREFRLQEITDARVQKRLSRDGATYLASILFESDKTIRIRGSRSDTLHMVNAIREFLQIPGGNGV